MCLGYQRVPRAGRPGGEVILGVSAVLGRSLEGGVGRC